PACRSRQRLAEDAARPDPGRCEAQGHADREGLAVAPLPAQVLTASAGPKSTPPRMCARGVALTPRRPAAPLPKTNGPAGAAPGRIPRPSTVSAFQFTA